ncbi:MAG: geranylgeranylglycerol-phosphate geranylgeranyltransferase [Bacteroidia bacterium]
MASNLNIFSREQRIRVIRFLAFLSLIRWYNLLVVAIAQYLAAYFILHNQPPWQAVLLDFRLLMVVLSTSLVIAGGYIINAFYDIEKDMANRPEEVIMGRIISKALAMRAWVGVNMLAIGISFLLLWQLVIFNGLFAGALWFYSHKLKKKPLMGELTASVLTVAAFFAVCVYYGFINEVILVYAVFILLITLIRELIKDLASVRGDMVYGYQTFPAVYGLRATKKLLYLLITLTVIPFALLYAMVPLSLLLWYFAACAIVLFIAIYWIWRAKLPVEFEKLNTLFKLLILSGVASIVLM